MKKIDLTGQRFGRLVVKERCGTSKDGQKIYLCQCDCGNIKKIPSGRLRSGTTKSCGCLSKEMSKERITKVSTKHGWRRTRLYGIWFDMRQRCYNEKDIGWHLYGGRGIKICDEWLKSFIAFRDWALSHGYADDLTIDRIDVNGDYCPDNCRWITYKEQGNNRRTCIYVTINGETKSVTEWCEYNGVNRMKAYSRIKKGWKPEDAVSIAI